MKTGAPPLALALKDARVCLDCDCLTDRALCPWCDRAATVPIAVWFRPLQDRRGGDERASVSMAAPAGRFLLVVQPQQRDLYRTLREVLEGKGIEVVYDRRRGQRRRVLAGPDGAERRGSDRRRARPGAAVYEAPVASRRAAEPPASGAARRGAPVTSSPRRQPVPV